jgi:hypothetical protein
MVSDEDVAGRMERGIHGKQRGASGNRCPYRDPKKQERI